MKWGKQSNNFTAADQIEENFKNEKLLMKYADEMT